MLPLFESTLLTKEPLIRTSCFFGILALMTIWEMVAPSRPLSVSKPQRWLNNLALVVLNTVLLRLIFPLAAVGFAKICSAQGWGVLKMINLPTGLSIIFSVIALDLIIYSQHLLFHALPWLWRLHKVHHADRDFDVTTGLRFHPLEILLSMGIKLMAIAILGASPLAVLIFEILLNATAMFNHGNVSFPSQLDQKLRWFIVTPDMHRIHHSVIVEETNSNYGFNLPWWDHLFGTYRDQPRLGYQAMTIGLSEYQINSVGINLFSMLLLPFQISFFRESGEIELEEKD